MQAGLLQKQYGQVGVKYIDGQKSIVMINGEELTPIEVESIPLDQNSIYLKADCDFNDEKDIALFIIVLMVNHGLK